MAQFQYHGNIKSSKNFLKIIEEYILKKYSITIFPEAHIWPFYTKIRNFKSVSFKYPVMYNVPVFSVTNTYQKYGKNRLRIKSYVDGPFFVDNNLKNNKEKQEDLRNRIYETMVKRSKLSNIEVYKYQKAK